MEVMAYMVGVNTQLKSTNLLLVFVQVVSVAATWRLTGTSSASTADQNFSNLGSP